MQIILNNSFKIILKVKPILQLRKYLQKILIILSYPQFINHNRHFLLNFLFITFYYINRVLKIKLLDQILHKLKKLDQ